MRKFNILFATLLCFVTLRISLRNLENLGSPLSQSHFVTVGISLVTLRISQLWITPMAETDYVRNLKNLKMSQILSY